MSCRVATNANGESLSSPAGIAILKIPIYPRFKLFLEPKALREDGGVDPRLPRIPVRANLSTSGQILIKKIVPCYGLRTPDYQTTLNAHPPRDLPDPL